MVADAPSAQLAIVDTCSILAIIEAPVKPLVGRRDLEAIAAIRTKVELAAMEETFAEFDRRVDGVTCSTKQSLAAVRKSLLQATDIAEHLGVSGSVSFDVAQLLERATIEARSVMNAATKLDQHTDDLKRAQERVRQGLRPGHRGGAPWADCVIVEGALRVARTRPRGTTLFLTANRADFCKESTDHLHDDLLADFADAGLEFATTWRAAEAIISRQESTRRV